MSFDHPGLLYQGADDYLRATTGFVHGAVAAGDAVLVAVPGTNLSTLREALSGLDGAVSYADMADAGRNPGRIIPGLLLAFADAHPGRRVSIVGEPDWPGRSAVERPACVQHEALVNVVFAGRDVTLLCPYDTGALDASDAWLTHPVVIVDGQRRANPAYGDPVAVAERFNRRLSAAPDDADRVAYAVPGDLSRVRRFATARAVAGGLAADRTEDLVTAVNELAENTMVHTSGGGSLTSWVEDGRLVCEISDRGFIAEPLAGRIPADPRVPGGRGLLLAHHLCDLVRVHTRPGATTIRLYMGL
ncbi:anti-sigma factor RsbA family regulatory protein [Actinoplanes subglobosus]|uniref:Anti-sigma factor RsbA family regulatory protein n=1 Tax=Actinoplanes subglobosus TaxID=1547892 RepID=A0ABV8JAK1_9ACTN